MGYIIIPGKQAGKEGDEGMSQADRDILETRKASKRKVGDLHTSLSQWHQGIGGHGYVKLGVAKGARFNMYSALCRLNDSISNPKRPTAKPATPTRIDWVGNVVHERRDASGILLPTARHWRYTAPTVPPSGPIKYGAMGFDGKRMD